MEENKKKTTKKTTTASKSTSKKETNKNEVSQAQPDMTQMFQMFQQFMIAQMNQQQNNINNSEKVKKQKATTKKTKSYLRKERGDDDVLVRSVAGTVCFKSPKTGITYNFMENGDEEWLTVDEILQMETASKKYLHSPWLVVEDDEINEILGISKVVDGVEKLNNIEETLEELPIHEIEKLIKESTQDYKNTFAGIVMNKIKEGELRDTVLINELGRILNVDFDLYK